MKLHLVFVWLWLAAAVAPAAAQSPRGRGAPVRIAPPPGKVSTSDAFLVSPTIAYGQIKDDALARLRHDGFLPGLELSYEHRSIAWRHGGGLGFRYGRMESGYGTPAEAGGVRWHYGAARNVYRNGDWEAFAGGRIQGNNEVMFYPLIDESHAYWLTAYDLRATGKAAYRWSRRSEFSAELALPLAGMVSRPPYPRYYNNDIPEAGAVASLVNEDLRFATLPAYIAAELAFSYRYVVSPSIAESVSYRFAYAKYDEPRMIQTLSHAVLLNLHIDPWEGL